MSRTFTKLFSSITESTVWCEPSSTRIVWITMLAMADHAGRVWGSVPGLANRARVSIPEAQAALETFFSPDQYSRTPDHDGRRIEAIDGGWRLLNHAKYRGIRDEESIKESKRKYAERRRAEEKEKVEKSRTASNSVDRDRANAEADTEADADTEAKKDQKLRPDGRFGMFWDAYPKKVAKAAAEKAWAKLCPDQPLFDQIMSGLAAATQSESWNKDGGQFIPHAATWLNGKRWTDAVGGGGKHDLRAMDYNKGVRSDGRF